MGFKSARKNAGIKLREVADALGVTEQAVCSWESGVKKPRADKLLALANIYHCTVDELLREEE